MQSKGGLGKERKAEAEGEDPECGIEEKGDSGKVREKARKRRQVKSGKNMGGIVKGRRHRGRIKAWHGRRGLREGEGKKRGRKRQGKGMDRCMGEE